MSVAEQAVAVPPVPTPCIGVCKMDEASGLCTGCARTGDEVAAWQDAGADYKLRVWRDLPARRAGAGVSCYRLPWSADEIGAVIERSLRRRWGRWVLGLDGAAGELRDWRERGRRDRQPRRRDRGRDGARRDPAGEARQDRRGGVRRWPRRQGTGGDRSGAAACAGGVAQGRGAGEGRAGCRGGDGRPRRAALRSGRRGRSGGAVLSADGSCSD